MMVIVIVDGSLWCLHDPDYGTRCPGAVHPSRNDARGLAQIIRTGWYRAVHVKSPTCRSWRALLTARRLVLNKMRDLENGLRALLREAGLKLGTPARKEFAARLRELTAADPGLSVLAEPLLTIIAGMTRELAQ